MSAQLEPKEISSFLKWKKEKEHDIEVRQATLAGQLADAVPERFRGLMKEDNLIIQELVRDGLARRNYGSSVAVSYGFKTLNEFAIAFGQLREARAGVVYVDVSWRGPEMFFVGYSAV